MNPGPYMDVVSGSIRIDRARGTVTLLFDLYHAKRRLKQGDFRDVSGVQLEDQGVSPVKAMSGEVRRYRLVVDGDAVRCCVINRIIAETAAENDQARHKEILELQALDRL